MHINHTKFKRSLNLKGNLPVDMSFARSSSSVQLQEVLS